MYLNLAAILGVLLFWYTLFNHPILLILFIYYHNHECDQCSLRRQRKRERRIRRRNRYHFWRVEIYRLFHRINWPRDFSDVPKPLQVRALEVVRDFSEDQWYKGINIYPHENQRTVQDFSAQMVQARIDIIERKNIMPILPCGECRQFCSCSWNSLFHITFNNTRNLNP